MSESRHDPTVRVALDAGRAWADAGLSRRLAVLQDAGRALAQRRDELHRGLRADGLSDKLADYYGDWVVRSARPELLARYAADHGNWVATGEGGEWMFRRPDGLVLLVVPGNSPTLNGVSLFSILLPGNAVIVRAPRNDRGLRFLCDEILGTALLANGFSVDLVPVVTGRTRPFLDRFLHHAEARTVVFFGNRQAGQAVAERAHQLDKKVVLELEGSGHTLVWKDADIGRAVHSTLHAFDFSGTPCPVPKHVVVHDAIHDEFVEAMLAAMPSCGRTIEADPANGNLIPLVDAATFEHAVAELASWGEVHTGGFRMDEDGTPNPEGQYAAPTLITVNEAELGSRRPLLTFDEEISYPVLPVVRCSGTDDEVAAQMADLVDSTPFGLRTSVWAQDPAMIGFFARRIEHVGMLVFNDEHSQCPDYASPWGGSRRSGGAYGENHLFWMKTSHLQALACARLTQAQQRAVFEALGVPPPASLAKDTPPRAQTRPPRQDLVQLEISESVAWLTLNRPERHNAVNQALSQQLAIAVEALVDRDDLIAVVVRGEGPSFCSGGDLRMLAGLDTTQARSFMTNATWSFRKLERLEVPIIACVHGFCMGGGFELALHCDEILATEDAVFAFPETRAGFVTTAGSVARLMGAVGSVQARHLLLTGARVPGPQALAMGLVTACCPAEELDNELERHLETYRELPRSGIAAMKELIRAQLGAAASSWVQESEAFESLVAARAGKS